MDDSMGLPDPPVGTRNFPGPRLFGTLPPPRPSPRGGAQGGSGSNPPNWIPSRGSREPVQKILRSTLLHSSGARHVRLGRRVNSLPYVLLRGAAMRASSGGEHSPAICQVIFKVIDGEEWERMSSSTSKYTKFVNIRHPSTSRMAKYLWKI